MMGLDPKVLVRYFAQDDPLQSPTATEIIERHLTEDEPGFASVVTMVETVWVLSGIYQLPGHELAGVVERMLQADTLVIQNEQEVFTAMMMLRVGRGSFSDALIGALGIWAGCASTFTFDREAARIPSFNLP